jgi:hypothetical protein
MALQYLPDELLIDIFGKLRSPMNLLAVACTCHRFSQIVHNAHIPGITVPGGDSVFEKIKGQMMKDSVEVAHNPLREIFRGTHRFEETEYVQKPLDDEYMFVDKLAMRAPIVESEFDVGFIFAASEAYLYFDKPNEYRTARNLFNDVTKNAYSMLPKPIQFHWDERIPTLYHFARDFDGKVVVYYPQFFKLRGTTNIVIQIFLEERPALPMSSGDLSRLSLLIQLPISPCTSAQKIFHRFGFSIRDVQGWLVLIDRFKSLLTITPSPDTIRTMAKNPDLNNMGISSTLDVSRWHDRDLRSVWKCGGQVGCANKFNKKHAPNWFPCAGIETFIESPYFLLNYIDPSENQYLKTFKDATCVASQLLQELEGTGVEKKYVILKMQPSADLKSCFGHVVSVLRAFPDADKSENLLD